MNKCLLTVFALFLFVSGRPQTELLNEIEDANTGAIERREEQRETNEDMQETMDGLIDGANSFFQNVRDRAEEWNTLTTFSPGECTPDFSTNASAMMRISCRGNSQCNNCFVNATRELNFIRRQLGRLSCIYNNTKNFTAAALSFGDNTSGIHGVMGLAWQSQRGEITGAMESMKNACKQKYSDMMGSLQRALRTMDDCESRYGLPDWYQRFGMIYFEFMKEKYKIAE
ncbi:MAG: hypothetical protein JNM68_07935 [Dinghuibacter sp.]|nr:hypothetical protein [Dinghuibacter sp.]